MRGEELDVQRRNLDEVGRGTARSPRGVAGPVLGRVVEFGLGGANYQLRVGDED